MSTHKKIEDLEPGETIVYEGKQLRVVSVESGGFLVYTEESDLALAYGPGEDVEVADD